MPTLGNRYIRQDFMNANILSNQQSENRIFPIFKIVGEILFFLPTVEE